MMQLPKSWADIKLKQLPDIEEAQAFEGNPIHKWNRLVAALTSQPLEVIEALPYDEVLAFNDSLKWVEELPTKVVPSFTINDTTYDLTLNVFKASTGQYAALTEYLKKDGYYKIAECAAVMCIPQGQTYKSSEIEDRAQLFWDNLSVEVAHPLSGFFLTLLQQSLAVTRLYLKKKITKIQKEMIESLTEVEKVS